MDTVMSAESSTEQKLIVQGPRQRSAQWGDLMTALAKAQGEVKGAKKDSENPHFKSSYADLASVWDAIREPFAKHGLAIMQWPRVVQNGVEIETIVAHGEQFISDVLWMPCGKMDAHGIGSAITYGRRYALMPVAGVAPDDDDGNGAVDGHKPGAPGTAGGGTQFRPERRARSSWGEGGKQGAIDEAKRDGLVNDAPPKAGPLGGREATVEEARKAKITAAVNKRVDLLKRGAPWMRDALNQFWTDNEEWIDWMTDPNNKAMVEYDRFSKAYADAELTIRPVELA